MTDRASEIRERLAAPGLSGFDDIADARAAIDWLLQERERLTDDRDGLRLALTAAEEDVVFANGARMADAKWLVESSRESQRLRAALATIRARVERCLMDGHTMQADMDDIASVVDKALKEGA